MRGSQTTRNGRYTVGVDRGDGDGDYSVMTVLKANGDGTITCLGLERLGRDATDEDAQAAAQRIVARSPTA